MKPLPPALGAGDADGGQRAVAGLHGVRVETRGTVDSGK